MMAPLLLAPAVLDALGTTVAAMPIEQLFAHREEMVGLQLLRGCQPCRTERMRHSMGAVRQCSALSC